MQSIKSILDRMKERYPKVNWNIKWVEHGILLSEADHNELITKGFIACDGAVDSILCDFYKVIVEKERGDDEVYEIGDYRTATFERDKLLRAGKRARIQGFPRGYVEWMVSKDNQRGTQGYADESLKTILDDFGEKVINHPIPNF